MAAPGVGGYAVVAGPIGFSTRGGTRIRVSTFFTREDFTPPAHWLRHYNIRPRVRPRAEERYLLFPNIPPNPLKLNGGPGGLELFN